MKYIGILTAGGDCPGLNAAIRGLGKAAINNYDMQLIGFKDGFRGIFENRFVNLDSKALSGILTMGGTLLGSSRHKPHKMPVGNKTLDVTDVIKQNYEKHHLDMLVCLGGNGTQKNAYKLHKAGMNVITLPKTIDNDIDKTDFTFGFDSALGIATDAIDKLHSTALSHHRIIVVEIMGNKTGWLTLGSGIAGGADVIMIPEIPYDINKIAESVLERKRHGKSFSIVAVAEGAMSKDLFKRKKEIEDILDKEKDKDVRKNLKEDLKDLKRANSAHAYRVASKLEKLTKIETRVTVLGHLQRGGTPSATDRLLATRLGTACARYIHEGVSGVLVAAKANNTKAVPLSEVVNKTKFIPENHHWIRSAKKIGICLGE